MTLSLMAKDFVQTIWSSPGAPLLDCSFFSLYLWPTYASPMVYLCFTYGPPIKSLWTAYIPPIPHPYPIHPSPIPTPIKKPRKGKTPYRGTSNFPT